MSGYTIITCDICWKRMAYIPDENVTRHLPQNGWTVRDGKDCCPQCSQAPDVQMWCDGSSDGKGPKTRPPGTLAIGGWAYVLQMPDRPGQVYEWSGCVEGGPATNQLMELYAIGRALESTQIEPGMTVHVYSDSECAIKWITGEYSCKPRHLQQERDIARSIVRRRDLTVTYHWVPGHDDAYPLHQRADWLAVAARVDGCVIAGEWEEYST
jgi:ribonuclease HI